jgi:hypothetical protein
LEAVFVKNSHDIWSRWCDLHSVAAKGVPLFSTHVDLKIETKEIGKATPRKILCRHPMMEELVLRETNVLVDDWRSGTLRYDGLIYMMFSRSSTGGILPLYIGKAETLGKGDGNLSVNLVNLRKDKSKFARWGDNYAYHIGDLSAAVLPGHPPEKRNLKYEAWARALFQNPCTEVPQLKQPVFFWGKAWQPTDASIWRDLSPTRLAFLEYLLIGVASMAFGRHLLNYEGRNRDTK